MHLNHPGNANRNHQGFNWADIIPSKDLKYHKCYGLFQCARLEVPLDWTNLSNPNTVTLAITKLPAVVDVADDSFGGTIVINPGGPSGSGVTAVLHGGKSLQNFVDSDKHFEILSFDPRGVFLTTPNLNCFQDDNVRTMGELVLSGAGSLGTDEIALNTAWSLHESIGRLCAETPNGRYPDGSNIRQYVSTALVAHDMVAIIDAVDADLQKELKSRERHSPADQATIMANNNHGPPLLNYWGLSYGTYLGNTFASRFPHRIGRMILDGVVDSDDYAATGWTTNLQDNNKTWATFFDDCFEAGPKCPLSRPSIRSAAEMQTQVEAFVAELQHNPLPVLQAGNAYVLTHLAIKTGIHICLYKPLQLWPLLAYTLNALMNDDHDAALSALQTLEPDHHFSPSLPRLSHLFLPRTTTTATNFPDPPPGAYAFQPEAGISILCGDGTPPPSTTKPSFLNYISLLTSQSPSSAPSGPTSPSPASTGPLQSVPTPGTASPALSAQNYPTTIPAPPLYSLSATRPIP